MCVKSGELSFRLSLFHSFSQIIGVEEMMEKLMQISKSGSGDGKSQKGKESKSPQSVTPLLMATNAHGVSASQEFGVVEPHQQVEMYADACLAATVMGYTEAAEHFMSLSHRFRKNSLLFFVTDCYLLMY